MRTEVALVPVGLGGAGATGWSCGGPLRSNAAVGSGATLKHIFTMANKKQQQVCD